MLDDTDKYRMRQNARTPCVMAVAAVFTQTVGFARGMCRSISKGGAFISGILRPPGEKLEIAFDVPAMGEVRAQAEVRYQHRHPDGPGVGIVFTRIESDDQLRLERFIQLFSRR